MNDTAAEASRVFLNLMFLIPEIFIPIQIKKVAKKKLIKRRAKNRLPNASSDSSITIIRIFQTLFSSRCCMTRAGLPMTTTFGGTSFITTAPALTIEFFPILIPGRITEFTKILTLSSILVICPSFNATNPV